MNWAVIPWFSVSEKPSEAFDWTSTESLPQSGDNWSFNNCVFLLAMTEHCILCNVFQYSYHNPHKRFAVWEDSFLDTLCVLLLFDILVNLFSNPRWNLKWNQFWDIELLSQSVTFGLSTCAVMSSGSDDSSSPLTPPNSGLLIFKCSLMYW